MWSCALPNISCARGNLAGSESIKHRMKAFGFILVLLVAVPAFGQTYASEARTSCKGLVHGTVFGRDGNPWSGVNLILEPVGDYDYVLPRVKTDKQGQYRFKEVCTGKWGVFIEDKEAGYPQSGWLINRFLYGGQGPQIRITEKHLEAQLDIHAPPQPGILVVHLTNSGTKAKIPAIELELKVNRKRDKRTSCEDSPSSACGNDSFLVPPGQDVKLHVTSKGFHEWKETMGRGKIIRLAAGQVMTIDVELVPL
jgi:hypothetical protein